MTDLNRLLSDNLAIVVGAIVVLLVILLVALLATSRRLRHATRAYRALLGESDAGGGALGDVLEQHVGRVDAVGGRLHELERLHASLEHRTLSSIQHIGLVRFNPFEDTGSDQSFAIALLDGERDGVVVSSLHGRTNTRVFAKPVEGGASRHALSDEEAQAIRIAVSGTGTEVRGA
jgi:hypothetical protein